MSNFQGIRAAMRLMAVAALSLLFGFGASAQTIRYIHTDGLGSPVLVTDKDRNAVERSEYEPYGSLLNRPVWDGPGYTGHVMDAATGLVYMQQRYYDQSIGRFISDDSVATESISGSNFNRYKYASNNPYKFTDPDGRQDSVAAERSYGAAVGYMLRNDPERLKVWEGGERAATTTAGGGKAAPAGAETGKAVGDFIDKGDYSNSAIASIVLKAAIGGALTGRAKNKLKPDSNAGGAHSVLKRDVNGKITNTATYEVNPKNPSGFQQVKRVDVTGSEHRNSDGTVVPTPHVSEGGGRNVRPAEPDDLPRQR
ncbi:RHS repeat-associated core domain-containing protein [Xanthomonas sp. D-109]|uniref:RHS repeat-associated core domain-containing protein n=1 Tax=Xanthomonas sp. D-109 TaxID=2821274 RepID=UPI001ADA1127|nr:RHS repeat-associated core domain-containing protein [Xanthomonas sp. D-109]MBO9881105.1 hypothetical protein [Xanthomonas sp. D-109]